MVSGSGCRYTGWAAPLLLVPDSIAKDREAGIAVNGPGGGGGGLMIIVTGAVSLSCGLVMTIEPWYVPAASWPGVTVTVRFAGVDPLSGVTASHDPPDAVLNVTVKNVEYPFVVTGSVEVTGALPAVTWRTLPPDQGDISKGPAETVSDTALVVGSGNTPGSVAGTTGVVVMVAE